MWAENFEACDTQSVKYLAFPYILFEKCHCFAFFNVLVAVTSVFIDNYTKLTLFDLEN